MKRIFTSILAIVAIAAMSIPAFGQGYNVTSLLPATQMVSGGATSNFTAAASISKAAVACAQIEFKLTGSGNENIVCNFKESVDGVNYPTAVTHTFTNAANGATLVRAIHPITLKGGSTLQLVSIVNGSSDQSVTNLAVKIGVGSR